MPRQLQDYLIVTTAVAAVTAAGWLTPLNYRALGFVYLLAVIALSLRVGAWPAVAAAVLSCIAWNFVFVPPRMSFSILHVEDDLLVGTYFAVALVGGQLTALRAARERERMLAESERLHRTLLDSVSHELKTPIAVLRSAGEQLGTDDPAKRRSLAAEVRTAVQRLDSLVTNLLDQTRLESGAIRAQMDWCDPRDLVAAARRALGERMAGHCVEIDIPASAPLFFADAGLMEQVAANLLLNAAMHGPAGGTIRVAAGAVDLPPRVFLSVTDAGPGIPPELRERIFEKFQRGPAARPGGLGLGLSIVRGFMRAQGGEVEVTSAPGSTRFAVLLPRVPQGSIPNG